MKYTIVSFRCDSDATVVALYEDGLLCLDGDEYHDKIREQIVGWLKCRQRHCPVKDEVEFFCISENDCDTVEETYEHVGFSPSVWPQNDYAKYAQRGTSWGAMQSLGYK